MGKGIIHIHPDNRRRGGSLVSTIKESLLNFKYKISGLYAELSDTLFIICLPHLQMYSCGSLAPKMGRGGGKDKGGCMHSTFRRPAEPWEKADG